MDVEWFILWIVLDLIAVLAFERGIDDYCCLLWSISVLLGYPGALCAWMCKQLESIEFFEVTMQI
jgi:hypothetical protein